LAGTGRRPNLRKPAWPAAHHLSFVEDYLADQGKSNVALRTVARVSWSNVGKIQEPGTCMFRFGWVTITDEDLAIWAQFPEATFALYKVPGRRISIEISRSE
jgi:hypothetical protein